MQVDNLPRPPTPVFKGRDTALTVLGRALAADSGVPVTQAVYGIGGVGKSELALRHAHAHRGDYQLMWWITAADSQQVEAGLAALAGRVCPPMALAGSTQEAAAWALDWLQGHDRWLLILDNVDDPEDVAGLLGQLRSGHIVLTTRRDVDWRLGAAPIRLDVLSSEPAAQIITARTGHHSEQDLADAEAVAAELGFLPLALEQAAAYMIQARIRPGQYLDQILRHPGRPYVARTGRAQQTITRLWDLTTEAIGRRDPGAVSLLQILACYAPDSIPRAILGGQDHTGQTNEQLGLLASYSMITLTADTVSIHRLVQAVTLAMESAPGPGPAGTALEWLDDAIPPHPDADVTGWPLLRALIPHIDALTSRYPAGQQPLRLGRVYNEFAFFHQSQGAYEQALGLLESALRIHQAHLGSDHPDVATTLGNLAGAYKDLGRPGEALPLQLQELQVTEAALGADHPDVAVALGSLALTYKELGRPADALPEQLRALQVTEAALGPDHPDVAVALGSLALTYKDLGRPGDALPLEQRALQMTETVLGPDHPDVAIRLGNLALTCSALGRAAEALPLERRALQISEAALGPLHPRVAVALGNLAATYGALGRARDALPLEQRALQVTETALGSGHPDVAVALGNLALTYTALERAGDALPLQQRALQVTEAALGPGHPRVAVALGNLAGTYMGLGRAGDALPLQRRALQISETALGPDHPRVATRLGNLALTYKELEQAGDALPLEQRALQITETALGPGHPDVAVALANLAITYKELGRAADALPLQQRALQISETALGPDHPRVAIRLGNLALTYKDLGRAGDALPLQQRALQISETALGPDHPDVNIALANLAGTYEDLILAGTVGGHR
jgi:tetratricopeptide (TPR) repeat protein